MGKITRKTSTVIVQVCSILINVTTTNFLKVALQVMTKRDCRKSYQQWNNTEYVIHKKRKTTGLKVVESENSQMGTLNRHRSY